MLYSPLSSMRFGKFVQDPQAAGIVDFAVANVAEFGERFRENAGRRPVALR